MEKIYYNLSYDELFAHETNENLTGFEKGLPLPESLEILGKEKTLERIKKVL